MSIPDDVRARFPEFYNNETIEHLSYEPRWTVSDSSKMPINMRELITTGRLWGAHEISAECLVTLPEMLVAMRKVTEGKDVSNNAFYLRSSIDKVMILDIEKTCPPEIAAELLKTPALFAETSMSGKGYHLVLPLPRNYADFPIAMGKKVLKEENGHYEILLDHWVTFTRNAIPFTHVDDNPAGLARWDAIYEMLASKAVETLKIEFHAEDVEPDVYLKDKILELLIRSKPTKTLSDFDGDYSRFEFSTLGSLYNKLRPIIAAFEDYAPEGEYTNEVKAWFIYKVAMEVIPHRDKHDEMRNGMPLLLASAVSLVGSRAAAEAEKAKKES